MLGQNFLVSIFKDYVNHKPICCPPIQFGLRTMSHRLAFFTIRSTVFEIRLYRILYSPPAATTLISLLLQQPITQDINHPCGLICLDLVCANNLTWLGWLAFARPGPRLMVQLAHLLGERLHLKRARGNLKKY